MTMKVLTVGTGRSNSKTFDAVMRMIQHAKKDCNTILIGKEFVVINRKLYNELVETHDSNQCSDLQLTPERAAALKRKIDAYAFNTDAAVRVVFYQSDLDLFKRLIDAATEKVEVKIVCHVCEGRGFYTSDDYYPPKYVAKCDECGGSGYITEDGTE